ncbi:MAG: hypothetical protein M3177_00275 [Pseudomonadota bacterium]|nr:hypothetical protein [Pseudomonadota bacterium]
MRALTLNDFRGRRGDTFAVRAASGAATLVLAQVQELPPSGRDGGSFRLEFHGPPQPMLQQGTYPFLVGYSWVDIFIVPIGTLPQAMRYEAIFY